MNAEPIIRRPFVCGSCGGTFFDRHECPTIPSQTVPMPRVFMRPQGDTRKDAVVKLEMFREWVAPRYHVRGVLDDRDQVVEMWRSLGLLCAQVAPGNF